MKRCILVLLLLCLSLPALAEAVPDGALFSVEGRPATVLFLADGRVAYVPIKKEGDNDLPRDELRCVDKKGSLLWSCALPAGIQPWGGPHLLSDGRFALVNEWADGKRYLEIISAEGVHLQSLALPENLKPLLVAGDKVYGTLQEKEVFQMYAIGLDGQAEQITFDVAHPNAVVMWAWPKEEGHMLHIMGRLSREEDFSQRTGNQWLVYLDAKGQPTLRTAWLPQRNYINGFGYDAALNHLGGLTALGGGKNGRQVSNSFSIHTYAPHAETLTGWYYALDAFAVKPQLIDQRVDADTPSGVSVR